MKKITTAILFLLLFQVANSQTDVYLNINHLLGSSQLTTSHVASNNLGDNFKVDRLEYYIGEIVLNHGRGQTTVINNTWILVDATQTTNVFLGTFNNLGSLTSISFGIGVDTSVNHNDPLLWPVNHPLAPRSPSMHWGWASGYRFVAFEGKTGTSMNDNFQIHALGDVNYFKQTISTTGYLVGNDLTININADYTQALKNIAVNGNLFNHGETNEAATLLSNFNSAVFFQGTTGLKESNVLENYSIAPNPSKGRFEFTFQSETQQVYFKIYDASGRLIKEEYFESAQSGRFEMEQSGVYTLNIYQANEFLGSHKLVVE